MVLSSAVTAVAVERSDGRLGRAAAACMQGVRNRFEDAHLLDHTLGVAAVFDGHLGDEAAAFCQERLHLHVAAAGEPSRESLIGAFAACDAELRKELPADCEAGTTATLAVIRENGSPDEFRILVANCGDSRAVLWRTSEQAMVVTRDHRPADAEEKRRIEAAGGFVSEESDPARVDGELACSRALGAFRFKDTSRHPTEQKVCGVPEVYEWSARRGDWLILGCDGVWDTFSNEKVIEEVCKADGADLGATLVKTLELCTRKEADDNLTLVVMELGAIPESKRDLEVRPGNFVRVKEAEVVEQYVSFCRRFGFELTKQVEPKKPPVASLSPADPVPGPRFGGLPPPKGVNGAAAAGSASTAVAAPSGAPAREQPSGEEDADVPLEPLLVVGPSGVGKGTLIKRLMSAFPGAFGFSVSHTTRRPRPGEVDGEDYHFTSLETMQKEVEQTDNFIEHAHVHGNLYGTSRASVEKVQRAGKVCVLDIDIQGAKLIKEKGVLPKAKFLFVAPPSLEELERRLRHRGTETEEALQERLRNAEGELDFAKQPGFWDHVLVNEDLGISARRLCEVVRGWYPGLTLQMKVTCKRPPQYYARSALALLAQGRHKAAQLEVRGLGGAIASVTAVLSAVQAEGHELELVETRLLQVFSDAAGSDVQVPELRVVVRLAEATPPACPPN